MDTQTLHAAVAQAFVTTGAATPPWPNPRPGMEDPLDEEYSRCPDPGKYRILRARAEAWAQALTGLGLAAVEEVADPVGAWREKPPTNPDRALRLRPVRAGTVPLLLGFVAAIDDEPDTAVLVGAGEPAALAEFLPDCGCDACDDGSDNLLEVFDEHVSAVVTGDFVQVSKRGGTVTSTGSGWSADGDFADSRDIDGLLRDARAGRTRHGVVHGDRWW